MKNLKIIWPAIIGITIAVSVTSCNGHYARVEQNKIHLNTEVPNITRNIKSIDEIEIPEIVIIKDGNALIQQIVNDNKTK